MRRALLSIALVVAFPIALASAQDKPPSPAPKRSPPPLPRTPRAAEIRALIERLGDPEHAVREAARARLIVIGEEAVPYVERAVNDKDAERAWNAQEIMKQLRWRVPPGLKAAVGGGIEDFPSLSLEQRKAALEKLAKVGLEARAGASFVATIARLDPDAGIRAQALEIYLAITPDGNPAIDQQVLDALDQEAPSKANHGARARLLLRLGRPDEALASARKAASGGKDPAMRRLLADMLVDTGKAEEALPLVEEDAKKNPDDLESLVRLAEIYWKLGRRAEGDEVIAKVQAETETATKEVFVRLERAFLRAGRAIDARDVVKKALARYPYDRDVNVAVADLDLVEGRIGDALRRYLNELRYTEPASEPFRRIREKIDEILTKEGEPDLAKDDFFMEDVRRGGGKRAAPAKARYGRFLVERGLVEDGARALAEAAALDPESADARVRLGEALEKLGREDDARRAYEAARALDPKDARAVERLKALGRGDPSAPRAPNIATSGVAPSSGLSVWDRRIAREQLVGEPESASDRAIAPLVTAGRVIVIPTGVASFFGFDATSGAVAFQKRLTPPPPPDGYTRDQVGLEPIAVVEVPSGAAAAVEPARARDRSPLVAILANVWARAAHHRSWKKAQFHGLHAWLIDPKDGRTIERFELHDEPLAPIDVAARAGRAVAFARPREGKLEIVLIDLVAMRTRWRSPIEGGGAWRPLLLEDALVAAWDKGICVLGLDGSIRATVADESASASTGAAPQDGAFVIGGGERLLRVAMKDGAVSPIATLQGESISGDLLTDGARAFVATHGGPARAIELASGKIAWSAKLDKAAERALALSGGRLFLLNGGGGDLFQGETPALVALDAKDGALVWRRPVERPATLASGGDLVVVAAGGLVSAAGLWVTGVKTGAQNTDARARRLEDLFGALNAALAEDELEVAALVARRYAEDKGGLEKLETDELVLAATAWAKSGRKDEADAALSVVEAKDKGARDRVVKLRADLGLKPGEEGVPKDPQQDDTRSPKPKPQQPQPKPDGAKPAPPSPSPSSGEESPK